MCFSAASSTVPRQPSDQAFAEYLEECGKISRSCDTVSTARSVPLLKQASGGEEPSGGLLDVSGNYCGVTGYGGTVNSACTFGCGVVYRLSSSGKYSVFHRFTGGTDGGLPSGSLTEDASGNLYGATDVGGSGNNGVIYEITP
jgi:uncharacterized repeat protein (TIGR03803 family)